MNNENKVLNEGHAPIEAGDALHVGIPASSTAKAVSVSDEERQEIPMQKLIEKVEAKKKERRELEKKEQPVIAYAVMEEFSDSFKNKLWLAAYAESEELKSAIEAFLKEFGAYYDHLDRGYQGEYGGSYIFMVMRQGEFEKAVSYLKVATLEIDDDELLEKWCDFRY